MADWFFVLMAGDRSTSEPVFASKEAWRVLWAIESLARVAPDLPLRMRNDSSECVLEVLGERWRVPGAAARQEAA